MTTTARQQLNAIEQIAEQTISSARLEGWFADNELNKARHCEGLAALSDDARWTAGWAEHARDCRDRAARHLAHLERDAYIEGATTRA